VLNFVVKFLFWVGGSSSSRRILNIEKREKGGGGEAINAGRR